MAMTVEHPGFPLDWWDHQFVPPEGYRAEIIQGELVVTPSPGMPNGVAGHEIHDALRANLPHGLVIVHEIEWRLGVSHHHVTNAPLPDLMVCRRDRELTEAPLLAVEILSPSDFQTLSDHPGLTRIAGKRLDYAAGGLAHYLEVDVAGDPDHPTVTRYELQNGTLVVADTATVGSVLSAAVPYPYQLDPAALLR